VDGGVVFLLTELSGIKIEGKGLMGESWASYTNQNTNTDWKNDEIMYHTKYIS
jgi:hypothetical protein